MPAAYIQARVGTCNYVISPRTTAQHKATGRVNITPKRYAALQRQWEIETYGAPLKELAAAAPRMLVVLRQLAAHGDDLSEAERSALIKQAIGDLSAK